MSKHLLVMFLTFTTAAVEARGANFYVQKGATGSNNGTSWTNAWKELSGINFGSVACGDTIWIAGGVYTTNLSVNKNCTSETILNINRVLSTDSVATSAAGWNSSFDSQVTVNGGARILVQGGAYYSINGRVGSPASNNFGISVKCTDGSGGCDGIDVASSGNVNNVTLAYLEVFGPGCVSAGTCGGGGATGINAVSANNVTILIDHCWVHMWGELIRTSNWINSTIQYSYLSDTHNDGQQHEDIMYNYPQTNFTVRYNTIWGSPNDGIFFDNGGTDGFYFYGNTYYHSGGQLITFKVTGAATKKVFLYNNVFENDGTFGDFQPGWLDFSGATANTGGMANNIFENIYVANSSAPTASDFNAYTTSVGVQDHGTHSFMYNSKTSGASVVFVNESPSNPIAADFHLTETGSTVFGNGLTLAAPYNFDVDGNVRGVRGSWTIGAYQNPGTITLAPPTALTVAVQ